MIFDRKLMEDILELQRKVVELSNSSNPNRAAVDFMRQAVSQWSMPDFPWNEALESLSSLWDVKNQNSPKGIDPDVNMIETKEEVLVKAKISGIADPDDLAIKLRNNILYVTAKMNQSDNGDVYSRSIRLPVKVTVSGAKAVYQDGNLTVSLPKMPEKEETIPVSVFET
jgi:HSP20 family molecular chaperone IbpA